MNRAKILLLAVVIAASVAAARGEDWPGWRGANHNGVVYEKSGWPDHWPPKKLWSRSVGYGCTSPIIVGGKLYVMGWQGGRSRRGGGGTDTLYCIDAASGKELWKQSYPCPYQGRLSTGDESAYGGPSSTPTFDNSTGLIYTLSIDGDLRCWDTRKGGVLLWKLNFYDKYKVRRRPHTGGGTRDYGYPNSVLIRGETLLVEAGAPTGTVMGLDKKSVRLLDAPPDATGYRELARLDCGLRAICYPHITLAGGILCAKDRNGAMVCFDTTTRQTHATAAKPQAVSLDVKMPKMSDAWPGNTEAAVFVWATGKSPNKIGDSTSSVKPRDDARIGAGGEMVLGRGAMLAQGADAALLEACKASDQLSIEAVVTPDDTKQDGPARIISFSQDAYKRNFTLGQQGAALVLRLRTTRTGENGMKPETSLCELAAAKPQHVIVTYSPGKLSCYLNGKSVLQSGRVAGDFSNWSPMHLLFGDEWDGKRRWSGKLQGIAIHARVIGAKEAAARHKLAIGTDRRGEK